jgi:ribosomal protein S18 acetylase RimI-like enzyme
VTFDPSPKGGRDAVALRLATDADYDFMRVLYHSTRAEEMLHFPFDDSQKNAFLDWQFSMQWKHYAEHYPTCERSIIEVDGVAAGRLYVDRWKVEIRVVDIALLPEFRDRGIGAALMREVMEQARAANKQVSIHVEVFNPARALYDRLGFVEVDTSGAYALMRWTPPQVNTAS